MLAIPAYYDGNTIRPLVPIVAQPNQRIIITIMDEFVDESSDSVAVSFNSSSVESEKTIKKFDFSRYGHRTSRGQVVDEYMKEMRANDRF